MPKLSSRSKHEEFKSNSALQIRDQKERKVENARKEEHKVEKKREAVEFCRIAKISQATEFRRLRNCPFPATVHPADHCSLSYDLLFLDFFCYIFGFLPSLSLVIAFDFGSFYNFSWLGQYISSYAL